MEWIRGLYIAATIFGAGVTLADMVGVFANLGSDDGDGVEDGADAGEFADDGDSLEFDEGGTDGFDDSFEADTGEAVGAESDGGDDGGDGAGEIGDENAGSAEESDGDDRVSIAGHDRRHRRNPVLTLLTALRTLVYFALGFGPVGWFATTQYPAVATTLLWSVPTGLAVAVGTRALRAFMRKDLSSDMRNEDIIMEKGVVIVSIGAGQVGRVRISVGGVYVDRFAKAKVASEAIRSGETIRVVDSDDEYVYVESEQQ